MKSIVILFGTVMTLSGCSVNSYSSYHQPSAEIYSKIDVSALQACATSIACPIGQSCTEFLAGDVPRCYTDGRESDVIGCTRGQLFVFESEPAQVSCD